jgi:hypothetical protein
MSPNTISEKYSAGLNLSATSASGEVGDEERRDAAGDERADRGHAERGPGATAARHLMAVERGHDRGGFARNVDQDRGGRAAVLGAVIDAGEHDQGGRGPKAEGEGQQHGNGRDRADAGQHADQGAEETADEAVEKILPAQRHSQAECEIGQRFHCSGRRPERQRQSQ